MVTISLMKKVSSFFIHDSLYKFNLAGHNNKDFTYEIYNDEEDEK